MKKFCLILLILFIFFTGPALTQDVFIINDSPNHWTIIINNKTIDMNPFFTYKIESINADTLLIYALEIVAFNIAQPFILSHGFMILPGSNDDKEFFLSNAKKIPIILQNDGSERLVEHHDRAILLTPWERRELKNAHVSSNKTIKLENSLFVDGKLVEKKGSIFLVIFVKNYGIVYF